MPEKRRVQKAKAALRQGKRPTTAAGEFVREEVKHVRQGRHGARSPKQAIAIGLSKARRAGVPLPPPGKKKAKKKTRRSAQLAYETGQGRRKAKAPSRKRRTAVRQALKREPKTTTSRGAMSKQAKEASARRRHT